VIRSQGFFENSKGALIVGFGALEIALVSEDVPQIVESYGDVGMFMSEGVDADFQGALIVGLGAGIISDILEMIAERIKQPAGRSATCRKCPCQANKAAGKPDWLIFLASA